MNIRNVPTSQPIPYARNPRKNSSAIDKVAASLKEFGWQQPIVLDAEGVVVVGHTRLAAAKKLGMETVPVVVASELTPAQIKAYRIADNRTQGYSEWDEELLALEVEDLRELNYDVQLTALSTKDLNRMFPSPLAVGDADTSEVIEQAFHVIALCESEDEQREVIELLTAAGHECRALLS